MRRVPAFTNDYLPVELDIAEVSRLLRAFDCQALTMDPAEYLLLSRHLRSVLAHREADVGGLPEPARSMAEDLTRQAVSEQRGVCSVEALAALKWVQTGCKTAIPR